MKSGQHWLFVYGSLLSGFNQPAFEYIRRYFTFIGPAKVKGVLYDMGTYPAAIPSTGEHYIVGELYKLNSEEEFSWAFSQLDGYEGIHSEESEPTLYRREEAAVYERDQVYSAWIYWFYGDIAGMPQLSSGDVSEYFAKKQHS